MLSPDIIKKIKRVHIRSSRTVNTMMAGQYRSVFRGSGIEFEDVREYSPGDDIKHIDWKVSARLGRPFIKRYREEREQVVMLLVDMSASQRFGTVDCLKQELAAEVASILAFNAIRSNDKVGAILFTREVERYIPPQKGSAHVWRVIKAFFDHDPDHAGTDIAQAIAYLGRVARKRVICFLISDFLSPTYEKALRIAARRHEVIGVLLSDPGEFRLPEGGILTARDAESGQVRILDAADRRTREAYSRGRRNAYRKAEDVLKASGVDCIRIATDHAAADALVRYFRLREKRSR
ncbi:MAG: DUF58 domain-containing protein [Desulfobacterales bacterium]|nr:DUF58 domain-containing protein [Desulfobacterales bacterium]